jgi:hypothetical protein
MLIESAGSARTWLSPYPGAFLVSSSLLVGRPSVFLCRSTADFERRKRPAIWINVAPLSHRPRNSSPSASVQARLKDWRGI